MKHFGIIGAGLLVIILLVAIYLITSMWLPGQSGDRDSKSYTVPDTTVVEPEPLAGYLYFVDDHPFTRRAIPQALDLETREVVEMTNEESLYYQNPAVRTGEELTWLTAEYVADAPWQYPYNDFLALTGGSVSGLAAPEVSEAEGWQWSPNGKQALFWGLSRENSARAVAESEEVDYSWLGSYGVYLYDVSSGEFTEVLAGVSARWMRDGSGFYYLASDGLHSYDLASGLDTTLAFSPNWPLNPSDSFVFNSDKSKVYITDQATGGLYGFAPEEPGAEFKMVEYISTPDRLFPYSLSLLGNDRLIFTTSLGNKSKIFTYSIMDETFAELYETEVEMPFRLRPVWSTKDFTTNEL